MRPNRFSVHRPAHAAFTLIELLVVVSIVAVLAALLLPVVSGVRENGLSTKCISNLKQISAAMDLYANDNNGYYPPLSDKETTVAWDSGAISPYIAQRYTAGSKTGRQSVLFICPDAVYAGAVTSDLSRTYTATDCMLGRDPTSGANTSIYEGSNRTTFASMAGTLVLYDACQYQNNRYSTNTVPWASVSSSVDLKANSTAKTAFIDYRHRNAFHGLYADGHVDTIPRKSAPTTVTKLMWTGRTAQ